MIARVWHGFTRPELAGAPELALSEVEGFAPVVWALTWEMRGAPRQRRGHNPRIAPLN